MVFPEKTIQHAATEMGKVCMLNQLHKMLLFFPSNFKLSYHDLLQNVYIPLAISYIQLHNGSPSPPAGT